MCERDLRQIAFRWNIEKWIDLFVPAQEYAAAEIAPAGHAHSFVQVLHQRVVLVCGERFDDGWDVCRFRAVEDGDEGLEVQIL